MGWLREFSIRLRVALKEIHESLQRRVEELRADPEFRGISPVGLARVVTDAIVGYWMTCPSTI